MTDLSILELARIVATLAAPALVLLAGGFGRARIVSLPEARMRMALGR